MAFSIRSSVKSSSVIAGVGAGLVFSFFIAVAMSQDRSAMLVYLRDPAAHFKFSPFAGVVPNFGVLATVSAAAICLFASFHTKAEASLLRTIGYFGLLIAFDDLLMLHEETLPNRLGVSEYLAYAVQGLSALIIAVRFRLQLPKAPLAGLFVAVMLLGLSVSLDAVIEFSNKQTVIEDGLKFVGLMVWSVYWIDRASTAMALQRSAP